MSTVSVQTGQISISLTQGGWPSISMSFEEFLLAWQENEHHGLIVIELGDGRKAAISKSAIICVTETAEQ